MIKNENEMNFIDPNKIIRISSNKDKKESAKTISNNIALNSKINEKDEIITNKYFIYSGIKIESIKNKDKVPYTNLICCVCLEIAMVPYECHDCEVLICGICKEMLKINGKNCIKDKCKELKKANKFLREMLNQLIVSCSFCVKKEDSKDYSYSGYIEHLKVCKDYANDELFSLIKRAIEIKVQFDEKANEKLALKLEMIAEVKKTKKITVSDYLTTVTSILSTDQKMEMYNATIDGNLNKFKSFVLEKNYPIFEELSAKTFKWTALHYAMHYGQENIILFIIDFIYKKNCLDAAISSKSSDGRCPMLCLLKSNSLDANKKKSITKKIMKNYPFKLNEDVEAEMKKRGMEDLILRFARR